MLLSLLPPHRQETTQHWHQYTTHTHTEHQNRTESYTCQTWTKKKHKKKWPYTRMFFHLYWESSEFHLGPVNVWKKGTKKKNFLFMYIDILHEWSPNKYWWCTCFLFHSYHLKYSSLFFFFWQRCELNRKNVWRVKKNEKDCMLI